MSFSCASTPPLGGSTLRHFTSPAGNGLDRRQWEGDLDVCLELSNAAAPGPAFLPGKAAPVFLLRAGRLFLRRDKLGGRPRRLRGGE